MARSVDICICTFRRPHLAETLASIAALQVGETDVRVIVSDNDETPSARPLVERIAQTFPFPIIYLHSPAANISIARNACLDEASAEFIAFVDDDETVSRVWLEKLLEAAEASGAAAVLGPVRAVYSPASPGWLVEGDFHSTLPVIVNGAIRTGYTCNVLIRWSAPANILRFDPALGRSGGEDTDFFYRLSDLGGAIVEAPGAIVYEPVPANRAGMGWLVSRRLRAGQTHGMRLKAVAGGPNLKDAGVAAAKAGYCIVMTAATAFSPVHWRRNLLRAVLHMGVISGIFGARQAVHYGEVKPS
ncbi:glycosyl transferase family A [Devosia geojensis]|uniref:Glycosyl transferase family A n=1 Tax=Devosia geojensis TaxID=443610 RepID=A0A0F5FVP4_9HYPH|nr:glycosyltransferase [Devosia geojensis]KKB12934.1 glycosyl transferase family A [Devosia geojensis]